MVRPGTAPTVNLPDKFAELSNTRLLVERVETSLETSNPEKPAIVHRLTCTAQDYQSLFADYYHGLQAPRINPVQAITGGGVSPSDLPDLVASVGRASRLPLVLGGSAGSVFSAVTWEQLTDVGIIRINGYYLRNAILAWTFTGVLLPRGTLTAGQSAQVRLFDIVADQALGTAVTIDSTVTQFRILDGLSLPLRSMDLTIQGRALGGIRAASAWNHHIDLEG